MINLETFKDKFREAGLVVVKNSTFPGNFFLYDVESGRTLGPQVKVRVIEQDMKHLTVEASFRIQVDKLEVLDVQQGQEEWSTIDHVETLACENCSTRFEKDKLPAWKDTAGHSYCSSECWNKGTSGNWDGIAPNAEVTTGPKILICRHCGSSMKIGVNGGYCSIRCFRLAAVGG